MARTLSRVVDTMNYDGLISGIEPAVKVGGGTIRKLGEVGTLVRGTVLAKSGGSAGDGKLVILGTAAVSNETLTPNCILAEDIEVGTASDVNAAVFEMGCFDPEKLVVKSGHTFSAAEKDELRALGIYLAAVSN